RFDSLAASKTATNKESYNTSDRFTIYLLLSSFYGSGTTAIERHGIIGSKIKCWQQSKIPTSIFIDDDMLKDRFFHLRNGKVIVIATIMS
ncbi:4010_t:CDS:1, partial [Acaulospora morrowiae]